MLFRTSTGCFYACYIAIFICNTRIVRCGWWWEVQGKMDKWEKDSESQNAWSAAWMRCAANHDKSHNAIQIWGFALLRLNRNFKLLQFAFSGTRVRFSELWMIPNMRLKESRTLMPAAAPGKYGIFKPLMMMLLGMAMTKARVGAGSQQGLALMCSRPLLCLAQDYFYRVAFLLYPPVNF